MNKFKRLAVTVGALAALAVGGAAFAQAQNSSNAATAPIQQSMGEETSSGDTDGVQSDPEQNETDSQDPAAESANEQNDGPESASENDGPDGPNDQADGVDAGQEVQGD